MTNGFPIHEQYNNVFSEFSLNINKSHNCRVQDKLQFYNASHHDSL